MEMKLKQPKQYVEILRRPDDNYVQPKGINERGVFFPTDEEIE